MIDAAGDEAFHNRYPAAAPAFISIFQGKRWSVLQTVLVEIAYLYNY